MQDDCKAAYVPLAPINEYPSVGNRTCTKVKESCPNFLADETSTSDCAMMI